MNNDDDNDDDDYDHQHRHNTGDLGCHGGAFRCSGLQLSLLSHFLNVFCMYFFVLFVDIGQ